MNNCVLTETVFCNTVNDLCSELYDGNEERANFTDNELLSDVSVLNLNSNVNDCVFIETADCNTTNALSNELYDGNELEQTFHNIVGSPVNVVTNAVIDPYQNVIQSELNSSAISCDVPFPDLSNFRNSFQKNFIFAHQNVNGLQSKLAEIHEIVRCQYIDFFSNKRKLVVH